MKKLISIIVPVYNLENYIEKAISTVLNQTYKNFEVIIINDGSNDKTYSILEKLRKKDTRIKLYQHENRGVSQTRNRGISLAKGEYIYFFDGDDYIEEYLLEKAISIFESKEVGMFSFGYKMVKEKKEYLYSSEKYNGETLGAKEFLKLMLKKELSQSICSFIIKKRLLEGLAFNEKLLTGEDLDLQLRILLKDDFRIFYDRTTYFYYKRRKNSATNKKIFYKNLNTLDFLDLLRKEMLEKNVSEFKNYHIVRFFYIIKGLSINGYEKKECNQIKLKLKKYDYILKELNFYFERRIIILNILKSCYNINFKLILLVFKIANFFNIF